MPKPLVWVGKLFIPSLKDVYRALGKTIQYNNERMINDLGIEPRPAEESLIDLCYSLVELGLVKKTSGYLGHPSTRPTPPPSIQAETPAESRNQAQDKPADTAGTGEEAQPTTKEGQKGEEKPADDQTGEEKPEGETGGGEEPTS